MFQPNTNPVFLSSYLLDSTLASANGASDVLWATRPYAKSSPGKQSREAKSGYTVVALQP
jgi:hypothetical protein